MRSSVVVLQPVAKVSLPASEAPRLGGSAGGGAVGGAVGGGPAGGAVGGVAGGVPEEVGGEAGGGALSAFFLLCSAERRRVPSFRSASLRAFSISLPTLSASSHTHFPLSAERVKYHC
jgi:hypothetical protein